MDVLVELTADGSGVRVTLTLNGMAIPPNEQFRIAVEKAVRQEVLGEAGPPA